MYIIPRNITKRSKHMHAYILIIILLLMQVGCTLPAVRYIVNTGNNIKILYINERKYSILPRSEFASRPGLKPQKEERIVAIQNLPVTEEDLKNTNYELVKIGELSDMIIQLEKKKEETGKSWVYTVDDNNNVYLQPDEGEIRKMVHRSDSTTNEVRGYKK